MDGPIEGCRVGVPDRITVGCCDGFMVILLGAIVGVTEGNTDGNEVVTSETAFDGVSLTTSSTVGAKLGDALGLLDGELVGPELGRLVGDTVGEMKTLEGTAVGSLDIFGLGPRVGSSVETPVERNRSLRTLVDKDTPLRRDSTAPPVLKSRYDDIQALINMFLTSL